MIRHCSSVALGMLTLACAGSASTSRSEAMTEREAFDAVCNGSIAALEVAVEQGDPHATSAASRATWLWDWIQAHVERPETLEEFRQIAAEPDASARSARLAERARAAGVAECRFTEVWAPPSDLADAEPAAEVVTTPETPGTITRDAISEVISGQRNQVRFCYETALAETPELAGDIEVRFVIGADGAVTSAEVESSTLASPTVESCVIERVRGWRFPPPDGGPVAVRYPYRFAPG